MKPQRIIAALLMVLLMSITVSAQSIKFGLKYTAALITKASFDQEYFIFSNHTSLQLNRQHFDFLPTFFNIFNSGFFIRYNFRSFYIQYDCSFETYSFAFAENPEFSASDFFIRYSSISNPLIAAIRLFPDNKTNIILQSGIEFDYGVMKSNNYYSFIQTNNTTNFHPLGQEITNLINDNLFFYMAGLAFESYATTYSLMFKQNISEINREINPYNANFKNMFMINFSIQYVLSSNDLKIKASNERIKK